MGQKNYRENSFYTESNVKESRNNIFEVYVHNMLYVT